MGMVKDQLQRSIQLDEMPVRVVSLVPSLTELLCDLGLETVIVGITKFCIHPAHLLKEKQIVGGTKQVNYEKIKALHPDLILCNKEENTKEMIAVLEHIAPIHISDINNLDASFELIEMYGGMFNKTLAASRLIAEIKRERVLFKTKIAGLKPATVIYFIWKSPWMVAGGNTFINSLLADMHLDNIYTNLNRYPEIQPKEGTVYVEYVFLSSEPFPFKEKHLIQMKTFYPNAKIILVDGEMFSWYGSRLKYAYRYFISLCERYRF